MEASGNEEVWNYIQTLRLQLNEQKTLINEMRKEVRGLKDENAYLGREASSSRTDRGKHLHQTDPMKIDKYWKVVELLSKGFIDDFDFDFPHWENGNYDDSFEYGVECGRQELLFEISQIVD